MYVSLLMNYPYIFLFQFFVIYRTLVALYAGFCELLCFSSSFFSLVLFDDVIQVLQLLIRESRCKSYSSSPPLLLVYVKLINWVMRWHSWLRHYVTSWKVMSLIPDGITGIFQPLDGSRVGSFSNSSKYQGYLLG